MRGLVACLYLPNHSGRGQPPEARQVYTVQENVFVAANPIWGIHQRPWNRYCKYRRLRQIICLPKPALHMLDCLSPRVAQSRLKAPLLNACRPSHIRPKMWQNSPEARHRMRWELTSYACLSCTMGRHRKSGDPGLVLQIKGLDVNAEGQTCKEHQRKRETCPLT